MNDSHDDLNDPADDGSHHDLHDDVLRSAMRSHADHVAGPLDPTSLERRMVRVDRQRTASRLAAVAAAVVVVVGAAVFVGTGGDDGQDTITTGSTASEVASMPRPTAPSTATSTTATSPEATPVPDPSSTSTSTTTSPATDPSGTSPPVTSPPVTSAPAPSTPDTAPTTPTVAPGTCEVAQESPTSSATPPVGVYTGRAAPGTTVRVQAKDGYGSAQTVVDASGEWRLEVTFTGAPADQPFEVWGGCPAFSAKTIFTFTWQP